MSPVGSDLVLRIDKEDPSAGREGVEGAHEPDDGARPEVLAERNDPAERYRSTRRRAGEQEPRGAIAGQGRGGGDLCQGSRDRAPGRNDAGERLPFLEGVLQLIGRCRHRGAVAPAGQLALSRNRPGSHAVEKEKRALRGARRQTYPGQRPHPSSPRGIVKENREPLSGLLSTQIVPPISSTSLLQMASPSPVPPRRRATPASS